LTHQIVLTDKVPAPSQRHLEKVFLPVTTEPERKTVSNGESASLELDDHEQPRSIPFDTARSLAKIYEHSQEKSRSVPGRQFGRYLMTMYDFDGDGLEDALQTFSDLFCVAEGRTGNFLKAERASKFVPGGGYYGSAIVTDFLGNGDEQLLFSSAEVVALLERNGKRIWHGDLGRGSEVRAGVGNADGDGAMDLFVIANRDGKREFQCWDATTGKTNWTLPLPAGNTKPTDPATADIDGDGRDECIFTMGNTVYAVGAQEDGQSGKIEWTLSMPGNLSPVAIADVKGDGVAQIVVSCADGTVYGIGDAKAPSAQGE
jgi:hypothetical protein